MGPGDRERVVKLVGMLGSSFAGEQANAASMLGNMARENKMTINELIAWAYKPEAAKDPPPKQPAYQRPAYSSWSYDDEDDYDDDYGYTGTSLIEGLRRAVGNPYLNDWERRFVNDVSRRYRSDYSLTEPQRRSARKILSKLGII